jgi:hypothetical protein
LWGKRYLPVGAKGLRPYGAAKFLDSFVARIILSPKRLFEKPKSVSDYTFGVG